MGTRILSRGQSGRGVKFTNHLHLAPTLRMSGTKSPLPPPCAFIAWTGATLILTGTKSEPVETSSSVDTGVCKNIRGQIFPKEFTIHVKYRRNESTNSGVCTLLLMPIQLQVSVYESKCRQEEQKIMRETSLLMESQSSYIQAW